MESRWGKVLEHPSGYSEHTRYISKGRHRQYGEGQHGRRPRCPDVPLVEHPLRRKWRARSRRPARIHRMFTAAATPGTGNSLPVRSIPIES